MNQSNLNVNQFAAALLLLSVTCYLEAGAQDAKPIPLQSKITHVQPMTGVVLWTDNDHAKKHPDAIALEYRYCGYNEVDRIRGGSREVSSSTDSTQRGRFQSGTDFASGGWKPQLHCFPPV